MISTMSDPIGQRTMGAIVQHPTHRPKSAVEKEWERHETASTKLETVLREQYGVCNGSFHQFFIGQELVQLKHAGKTQEDLLHWVEAQFPGRFETDQDKLGFVEMAIEVTKSSEAFDFEQDKVVEEDLGWPHRSWVYFKRATKEGGTRDPQRWFNGLNCSAVQDKIDPDRYLPANVSPNNLTLVGFLFGTPARIEVAFDENSTSGSVAKEVSKVWGCDANHTTVGYHGRPIWDPTVNLKKYGVRPGTLLHCMAGWESVESMKKAQGLVK